MEKVSYKELTDAVKKDIPNVSIFDVAKVAKDNMDEIVGEIVTDITIDYWDGSYGLGGMTPDQIKDALQEDQVIFVIKNKGQLITGYSVSPFDNTPLKTGNVKQVAEEYLKVYQQDQLKKALVQTVVDSLVEKELEE
jgi:hypothetical protein